jgi:hypothetical protein
MIKTMQTIGHHHSFLKSKALSPIIVIMAITEKCIITQINITIKETN